MIITGSIFSPTQELSLREVQGPKDQSVASTVFTSSAPSIFPLAFGSGSLIPQLDW